MLLQSYKIAKTMPSIVRQDWIGVWTELSNDVQEVLPYLNAVVKEAAYNHKIPNLSFRWKENVSTIGSQDRVHGFGSFLRKISMFPISSTPLRQESMATMTLLIIVTGKPVKGIGLLFT